jgi:hypothetical protein
MTRPGLLRWLGYAVTGRLPDRYADWVLHDATCSTWVLRHLARVLVTIAVPLAVLVLVLPTGAGLRALTAFVTGACVVLLTAILSNDMVERRLHRAGYDWGTGETVRSRRAVEAQMRTSRLHRERVAARRQRHVG